MTLLKLKSKLKLISDITRTANAGDDTFDIDLISDITRTANAGDDTFYKTRIFASYSLDTGDDKRGLQAICLTLVMTKRGLQAIRLTHR